LLFAVGTLYLALMPVISYSNRGVRQNLRKGRPFREWSQLKNFRGSNSSGLSGPQVVLDFGASSMELNPVFLAHYRATLKDLVRLAEIKAGREKIDNAVRLQLEGTLPTRRTPFVLAALLILIASAFALMILRHSWERLDWPQVSATVEESSVHQISSSRSNRFLWNLGVVYKDVVSGQLRRASLSFDGYFSDNWPRGLILNLRLDPSDSSKAVLAEEPMRSLLGAVCGLLLISIFLGYTWFLAHFYKF